MKLHSKKGYGYLFVFILSLMLIHFSTHLLSGSIPHLFQTIINPNLSITKRSSSTFVGIKYFVLRYSIYGVLASMFFFDHIHNPKWLKHPKLYPLMMWLMSIIFLSIIILGNKFYTKSSTQIYTQVFGLQIDLFGTTYYVYALFIWLSIMLLSFHLFNRKFKFHHSLWFTSLILLSYGETWEYANNISYQLSLNVPVHITIITNFIWRATPTFLLFFYTYRFAEIRTPLVISLIVSLSLSFMRILMLKHSIIGDLIRLSFASTYILLAYYMSKTEVLK